LHFIGFKCWSWIFPNFEKIYLNCSKFETNWTCLRFYLDPCKAYRLIFPPFLTSDIIFLFRYFLHQFLFLLHSVLLTFRSKLSIKLRSLHLFLKQCFSAFRFLKITEEFHFLYYGLESSKTCFFNLEFSFLEQVLSDNWFCFHSNCFCFLKCQSTHLNQQNNRQADQKFFSFSNFNSQLYLAAFDLKLKVALFLDLIC